MMMLEFFCFRLRDDTAQDVLPVPLADGVGILIEPLDVEVEACTELPDDVVQCLLTHVD